MTNIEKYGKVTDRRIDRAKLRAVLTEASASAVVERSVNVHRNRDSPGADELGGRPSGVILRLENVRATPSNLERIREKAGS